MDREILAANEAFYRAFTTRDFDAMDRLWATLAPVTCVHPGWSPARGREPVMVTWQSILSSPDCPQIAPANATAHMLGDGAAYVICEEHFNGSVLIATNIFVREAGEWKMNHHQAGHLRTQIEVPAPKADRGVN